MAGDAAPTPIRFDVEELLEDARRATGLDDFGPEDFHEPLAVLARTYDAWLESPRGRKRARRRLLQLLIGRLKVYAAFARHPEIRARPLRRPMVLTGLPRSGTSALFNLLAVDPAARPLRLWEAQFPDPLEELPAGAPDPRRQAVDDWCARGRESNPDFAKIHFTSADTPEECVLLQAFSLHGVHEGTEVMMEPYASWYRRQDLGPMYREYADLLRLLDWQRPGERWLLKAPAHMWAIEALIETLPDVSIVWSHRDPRACIASISSMTHALMLQSREMDRRELGPMVMDFYATSLERGLAARDRCDPGRFVDVHHDDLVADGLGVVESIHRHFGLDLDAPLRAALAEHERSHPKDRFGRHEYALADFGLEESAVIERFAAYAERFGIDLARR